MTTSDIEKIIAQGEGISIEFKEAKEKVPASFYETVVSFANTNGGVVLLGVDDDGKVMGIQPENKAMFLKNITTALNSIDNINPVLYLNPTAIDYEGKMIIVVQVPVSSQVHDHAGRVYIREYEVDAVRTLNPNNPYFNGIMDLDNFNPHPKNPNLRRFFTALGWADEIGSGIRNTKKYLPFYVEKAKPVFIDEPLFRTIIPLHRYTMSGFTEEWYNWLELDKKWLPKLTESLNNIEIDGHLQKMSWDEQISFLVSSWIEKIIKHVPSSSKNGTKSEKNYISDNQHNNILKASSQEEKSTKSVLSSLEKVSNLPDKRLQYLIRILFVSGMPITKDELIEIFSYRNIAFFRQNYLKPLESIGFIKKTNPDKPTASNQKYLITEKGKRFLTGQDF